MNVFVEMSSLQTGRAMAPEWHQNGTIRMVAHTQSLKTNALFERFPKPRKSKVQTLNFRAHTVDLATKNSSNENTGSHQAGLEKKMFPLKQVAFRAGERIVVMRRTSFSQSGSRLHWPDGCGIWCDKLRNKITAR